MKRKPSAPGAPAAAKNPAANGGNAASQAPQAGRTGPRPFNLHLFTTACMLTAAAWPFAGDPEKRAAVTRLVGDMTADMMRGLGAYKASPARADRPAYDCLWREGSTRLLRVGGAASGNAAQILLVPSLINRPDILDLDAQHSFARFLVDAGFDVHILDWGPPGEGEETFRVDDYITRRLYPALAVLDRPHVVGYCMGGTMAAGAVAAMDDPSAVRSLTLLAAPWDFHAADAALAMRMRAFSISATGVMETTGVLPVDWIQAMFASVDPLFAFNKFRAFAAMDPDSDEARRFVIVEDWLNDGVDLAAPAARQAIDEWYVENQPGNGVWTIGPRLVDAHAIKVPTLVVAAGDDRLVPAPSALAIVQQIDAADTISPGIGHIGMMASKRARTTVWQPVADWLRAR